MVDFDPEGELHFHRIFEAAGVAILITNAEGSFVESNSAGVELLGYSAEQLRGMSIRDVTHPEDLPECEALYAELIHGKRSHYKIEKRFLRGDGAVIWSVLTVSRLPRNEGPQFAIGIVENITERKRAEEALQASREHLEASVRASNTGLWDWNLRTNEVYYSPEWKSLLGYEEHEISSRLEETFNRFHPDDRQRTIAAILAFLRDPGPSFETECRLRHKDGSYRWILSRASVLRGADGRPYRMLGAHLDITEQKRTEERLREYEKAVEGLQEMILVIDRDYRYLIANRAYLTYRDLTGEQVIGHAIPDFMGREFFQTVAKPRLDECFQGRIVKYEKKYSFPRLGERQIQVSYFPIEGPHGVDRVACILQDVTDRKRAEEELRKAHERLTAELKERTHAEQQVRALTDRLLTAQEEERRSIARELHDDLSQEIAALGISVSNMKQSISEEDRNLRAHIEGVHYRISHLAERVRHLSRRLHPAVLEYAGIAAALKSYGAEVGAVNEIVISVEAEGSFDDVPGPVGLCLYRVAQEALHNVVKRSQSVTARVRIQRFEDAVSLTIQDDGQGFQEIAGNTVRGLGLVSMRERVRLMHGAIEIHSNPGDGTRITVSIPC